MNCKPDVETGVSRRAARACGVLAAVALAATAVFTSTGAYGYDELVEAGFPAGVTLLETSAYAQEGLVAHFDGIRNDGEGIGHSATTRVWKNLVSGGPDARFYQNANAESSNGYWLDNGFYFPGNVCAQLTSGIALGTYSTVQMATSIDTTAQTTGGSRFACLFSKGTSSGLDQLNIFIDYRYGINDDVRLSFDGYAAANTTRPLFEDWEGRYLTFMLGESGANRVRVTQTPDYGTSYDRSQFVAYPSYQLSWAGVPGQNTRWIKGTYHAVRIYSRNLGENEIAWNYLVDEVRFRGLITNGCVFVRSSVEGVGATNEVYFVNGTGTISAPSSVTVNGLDYIQNGYTLERYNKESGTWEEEGTYEGSSYTATRCAEICGERITWNWRVADTLPVTIRWTGGGDTENLLDPLNWNGYNAGGDSLGNVVPQSYSTVVVDGTTTFSIPEGTTEFPWLGVRFDTPITLGADCDWSALGTVTLPSGAEIDLAGHTLKTAGIGAEGGLATVTSPDDGETGTLEIYVEDGETFRNGDKTNAAGVSINGNAALRKTGQGVFVMEVSGNTYSGGTFVDGGTIKPPENTSNDGAVGWSAGNGVFGTGKITVAKGATFDCAANYAYLDRIVLAGGTLANTQYPMKKNTWGGTAVSRLVDDSYLKVDQSLMYGHTDTDLGGKTLYATIAGGQALYLQCSYITNGVFAVSGDGTLGNAISATDMSNATLELGCAINMGQPLTVKNYTSLYNGNSACNYNSAKMSVTGTFKPVTDKFYGCEMQDGSTIDLNARTGAWDTTSAFTSGLKTVSFAGGATVTIDLSQRADRKAIAVSDNQYVVTWAASAKPADSVTFVPDEDTASYGWSLERDDNGIKLKPKPGFMIRIGENRNIEVPGEWLLSNCPAFGTVKESGLQDWMAAAGANGLPRWQSYCLGLDPGDARSVVVCKAGEAQPAGGGVAITANIDVPGGSGAAVTAYLDKSADGAAWTQVGEGRPVQSGTVTFDSALGENETLAFFRVRVAVQ